jgi:hypothetical protein
LVPSERLVYRRLEWEDAPVVNWEKALRTAIAAIIAIFLGVAFVVTWAPPLKAIFDAVPPATPPPLGDFEKVMTATATGVAGVIAFWLGVTVPPTFKGTKAAGRLSVLGGVITFGAGGELLKAIIGASYALAYLVITLFAILAWSGHGAITAEAIKAQVLAALALFGAIASAYLKQG